MLEIEDVIKWLTEISLRPCDFATDYFDSNTTEHLANEALEICEDAKVFCKQRNDALELLKEHEEHEKLLTKLGYHWTGSGETLAMCRMKDGEQDGI